uniref:uncharacterized protein LOC120325577 isoform X1 n=1 Tax=Styela clava TaxID=7725 RepID=UPI00193A9400|nr:uncharacterized protein LOC120325577 isoform X1 [Styela clava]
MRFLLSDFAKLRTKELDEQKKIVEQTAEISELKKDLIKIQEITKKLAVELNEQKKTNAVKKELQGLDENLVEEQKETRDGMKKENCKLKIGNICYFTVIFGKYYVNYTEANAICKKSNADVGLIRDEESYNEIMKYLIKNMPKSETWIRIWTGIHFDPMTRDVTPTNSFIKWSQHYPFTGISHKTSTNVHLFVKSKLDLRYQLMLNGAPSRKIHGVICEILIL